MPFTIKQIANVLGDLKRKIERRSIRENWPYTEETIRGGKRRLYELDVLPAETQAALLKAYPPTKNPIETDLPIKKIRFEYNKQGLWEWAEKQTQTKRDKGEYRANLLRQIVRLMDSGQKFRAAAELVGAANNENSSNLKNWYYGVNKKNGARHYDMVDWDAALIPGQKGNQTEAECDPQAWDWYKGHYLNRRKPSHADTYRRLDEIAQKEGWVIPCSKTLERWIEKKVAASTIIYNREGAEALNKIMHPMKRDKTCFVAGEAVSGDGLKFDKLWIDWGDEIISTTTGWFWQDLYSNKFLAYRIAKSENTDLFRLATYDLTELTLPTYVQVDNTRVAANKAMTGKANNRYRFKDKDTDHPGILMQLGMDVHFTNPDHTMSNPGVKPIERSFGIGGIHDMVASHPKFIERGFSKKTAIPINEFRAVVAEEVTRFNARPKRRTDVCNGVMSFDEAFNESFAKATVRKATESQRRLLLLMPERVRANRTTGSITLKAGASRLGKNAYWNEALNEFMGQDLVAYYDPENLSKNISVYTLDGRFIIEAEHKPSAAFTDTAAAREHHKFKHRIQKAQKKIAADEIRMSAKERAALYPTPDDVVIPEPGIVQGNFKQKRQVLEDGSLVDKESGEIVEAMPRAVGDESEMWSNFSAKVAAIKKNRNDDL